MKLTEHHRKEKGHYKKVQVLHMTGQGQNMMVPLEIRTRRLVQEHYIHHLGHNSNRHILRIWDVFVSFWIHCRRHRSPCGGGVDGSVCAFCVVDVVLDDVVGLLNHLSLRPQVPPGMMHIP